ncbi:MAG: MarR family winged helix-turn-helix transcriptional regulator [Mycoplasmatales bacterium]
MTVKEILALSEIIISKYEELLSYYNLTYRQWEIVEFIYYSNSNTINAKYLSSKLNSDKRLISLNLSKLEEENMLLRVDDPNDKRLKLITLSDNALSICPEIIEGIESINEELETYLI